jgi:cytochrome c biogenesis protein CcmG/thiol:disulfide interchange protein DsbE
VRRSYALLATAALLLTGCSAAQGAGERVSSSSPAGARPSVTGSAPADLVASADLVPCPATDAVDPRDDGLPRLTLACLGDGPPVDLAGLRGRPTVVNLWASWCAPCRDELPLFEDLAGATRKLRVLGVDVQDEPQAALSLLQELGIHYASVRDDGGDTQPALRWTGLPMTVFVDADGVVTHTERSPITTAEQMHDLVLQHLGVDVTP